MRIRSPVLQDACVLKHWKIDIRYGSTFHLPHMPEQTKPVTVRIPESIKEGIEKLAEAKRQSISDWLREPLMLAYHNATEASPRTAERSLAEAVAELSHRVSACESTLAEISRSLNSIGKLTRLQLAGIRATIADMAERHHEDLPNFADFGLSVEEPMDQRITNARRVVLDAIERPE